MSVDGRDEPLDEGGGGTEHGGLTSRQVPRQGGRSGGAPGVSRPGGVQGHSVPAQRDRYDGVQVPSRERDPGLSPSDSELIGRMRAGDDTAYEELYRRHASAVRRYARTCCRDAHTADDLTAEVFARVLQAVRGGSGPEHAVRAYLLTTVRRVAASWTKSAKREHLVDDFAVFATQAARSADASDDSASPGSFSTGLDLGADVRAMHDAERSMAMRAFRSLPERWQAVLWHTEVEDESPSDVATLFGLDANGTRVLASRAREGLKQAYLQAHVSAALATNSEECARYADRLGAYARGSLRARAERGLRKHLEECVKCRLAAGQIKEVASGIPAVVPVAVIGWFGAAGYAKVAALLAGGAGAAGAVGVATVGGSGGPSAGGGATVGGSGGPSAGGGATVSQGVGAVVKAGVAAGVVAVGVVTAVVIAMTGDKAMDHAPVAGPPPSRVAGATPEAEPSTPSKSTPSKSAPAKSAPSKKEAAPAPRVPAAAPVAGSAVTPTPRPTPAAPRTPGSRPTPTPTPTKVPQGPTSTPTGTSAPTPPPVPPTPPSVFQWNELEYDITGDGTRPEMRRAGSSWVWQRYGVSIANTTYANGVTVHGRSSVTIDLNRRCAAYDALVGVDDLTHGHGKVSFSVYADGARLWKSAQVGGGDPAVPVHADLSGRRTVRLVVEPQGPTAVAALADWAEARFTCE